MYKLNEHISLVINPIMRGITPIVKKLIEDLIYRFDAKPNRIYNLLKKKKFARQISNHQTNPNLFSIQA